MTLEIKAEHPNIVKVKGIRGGRPAIKGTGIEVDFIVKLYKMGESVDEILSSYPHLNAAAVYDAISYYHDHQEEIEKYINQQGLENILEKHCLTIYSHGRIVPKNK